MLTDLPLTPPWITPMHKRWLEIGVPEFLENIGINFKNSFREPLIACNQAANPYLKSLWKIVPHSLVPDGVLHCYPSEIMSSRVIWEEWFLLDGAIHHHILSNLPFDSQDGTWTPEPDDKDHPAEVLGLTWHYENLSDLRPAFLAESGFWL